MYADDIFKSLYIAGSPSNILKCLPKVHKTNYSELFKSRIILAAYNTSSYQLSKYLVKKLAHFMTIEYTVDKSDSFSDAISEFPSTESYHRLSINFENLFTSSLPQSDTISVIQDHVFARSSTFLEMNRPVF